MHGLSKVCVSIHFTVAVNLCTNKPVYIASYYIASADFLNGSNSGTRVHVPSGTCMHSLNARVTSCENG